MNKAVSHKSWFPGAAGPLPFCAALVVVLGLLPFLPGCSTSTDPGPGTDPRGDIVFHPTGQGLSLRLSETREFFVSTSVAGELAVNWYRGGLLAGQDTFFTFVPAAVGRDTLEVSAFVGALRDTFFWVITVQEDVSVIPPAVTGLTVGAGPEPADVLVTWNRVTGSTFPLVEYRVAVSFDGPIGATNWDQADILARIVPVPDQIRYSVIFTAARDGMRPGERAWFAVRVADDRQQLSPLSANVYHDITRPWFLGGYVFDDAGLPLLGVILSASEVGNSSNTDGSGFFLFDEPFRDIDAIRIRTTSPAWYDFVTPAFTAEQDTTLVGITLITQYGLDDVCYGGDFLEYLRDVTLSNEAPGLPAESMLYTWAQYPVSVFIPAGLNQGGVDLEAASLAAMDFWNTTMSQDAAFLGITETDYFIRTADEAAADVVFLFEFGTQNYGQVRLLLPDGPDDVLGSVIPEKMEIWINDTPDLWKFSLVQGVALHEFGHVLGLLRHPDCSNRDYLMTIDGAIGSIDRLDPIHLDERRAVRTIRNLPQGTQMSDFAIGGTGFN